MSRPELILDTQIFRDAADGAIAEADWKRTAEHVSRKFRHRISPVTLYELLSDIAAGSDAEFEKHRDRVRRLAIAKKNRYLRLPRYFAAKHLFGDARTISGMEPDDFEVWSRVVLAAADRPTLLNGVSMREDPRMRYRLDLQDIEKYLQEGEDEFNSKPDSTIAASVGGESNASVDHVLRLLWREPSPTDRGRVDAGLNVALAISHDTAAEHSRRPWLRFQQLFYVCDPEIILVTSDAAMLSAAKNSDQADRVWDYDRLKREAAAAA